MYTVEERDEVRRRVLALADADARVVAGAVVGGLANGGGDRFSDLDLSFGVEGAEPRAVLDDWTRTLADGLGAVHLFDLPSRSSLYRVFLFPGGLQVDLSCTPAADFGARGPRFELLFGDAVERPFDAGPEPADVFGLAVHHALRARSCLERGRVWAAAYWIDGVRASALELACLARGLRPQHGRGLDELPAEVRGRFAGAFERSLEPEELRRALAVAVDGLLAEAGPLGDPVAAELQALAAESSG